MITDVHTSYLRVMLRTSEEQTKGWEGILDHATPRSPEPILVELRAKLTESRGITEGWRAMHDYAAANRTLDGELAAAEEARHAAELAQYSTGARLDAPPKPCTCGEPHVLGMVHRTGGHPCYVIEAPVAVTVNDDPAPTGVLPEAAQWKPNQETAFNAFEAAHRELAEQEGHRPGMPEPADGGPIASTRRDPYPQNGDPA